MSFPPKNPLRLFFVVVVACLGSHGGQQQEDHAGHALAVLPSAPSTLVCLGHGHSSIPADPGLHCGSFHSDLVININSTTAAIEHSSADTFSDASIEYSIAHGPC